MPDPGRRWQSLLAVQAAVLQASWVAVRLMIGYRAIDMGAHTAALGVIAASYAIPGLLIAFPAGRAADRLGGVQLSTAGAAALILGSVACAVSPSLVLLIVACVVVGVGQMLILVGQQSYVAGQATHGHTDSAFGLLTSAIAVGQVAGPPVAAWIATTIGGSPTRLNTTAGLLGAAALALLIVPTQRFLPNSRPAARSRRTAVPRMSMTTIVRVPGMWRALLVGGVVLTAVDLIYAFVPVWAVENGVSVATVGWLLALRAGVSVVSRVGLGHLVSTMGRKVLLVIALALAAAGLAGLAYADIVGAILVMIALGIGLGLPQPLTMSWVTERSDPAHRGAALGLRLTINRLLQVVMPLTVGVAAAPFGVGAIFLSSATLLTGMTAVVATAGRGLDTEAAAENLDPKTE